MASLTSIVAVPEALLGTPYRWTVTRRRREEKKRVMEKAGNKAPQAQSPGSFRLQRPYHHILGENWKCFPMDWFLCSCVVFLTFLNGITLPPSRYGASRAKNLQRAGFDEDSGL